MLAFQGTAPRDLKRDLHRQALVAETLVQTLAEFTIRHGLGGHAGAPTDSTRPADCISERKEVTSRSTCPCSPVNSASICSMILSWLQGCAMALQIELPTSFRL